MSTARVSLPLPSIVLVATILGLAAAPTLADPFLLLTGLVAAGKILSGQPREPWTALPGEA